MQLINDGNLIILCLNFSEGDMHNIILKWERTEFTNYYQQLFSSSINPNAFVLLLHYSIISYFYCYEYKFYIS